MATSGMSYDEYGSDIAFLWDDKSVESTLELLHPKIPAGAISKRQRKKIAGIRKNIA